MNPVRDPVDLMLSIAGHFLDRATDLDGRVQAAVDAGASATDIKLLMDLAATDRLRALSAAQAAAPFCRPRLQAIEVSPATPETRSRFDERLAAMTEDQVLDHLKRIAAGAATVALLEADEETDIGREDDEHVDR